MGSPTRLAAIVAACAAACSGCELESAHAANDIRTTALQAKIDHIIVIYQENWSFDGLYGKFPGADGLANAAATIPQVDKMGKPLTTLPQALAAGPDNHFPPGNGEPPLPVAPFDARKYVSPEISTGDLVHRYYHQQLQIDNGVLEPSSGHNDKFVAWSDNGGLVMSYFDATDMPEGRLAQEFVLADAFFHSAFGGSFLNHQWLICSCTPAWQQPLPTSDSAFASTWDFAAKKLNDSNLTFDGKWVVNTTFSVNSPHPAAVPTDQLLRPLTAATIGDRLSDAHISWKWYAGGWDDALAGKPDRLFQFHHQPFAYYKRWGTDGSQDKADHLQDETRFLRDLRDGTLPNVAFVKPLGPDNEHPGYAALARGQRHVMALVDAVRSSSYWQSSVIIITYDENGGRWDHVVPPAGDVWGPGSRVPTILVSPFARRHYVDHTPYETVSILKLIETRWNLQPLGKRDAQADAMLNAFDF